MYKSFIRPLLFLIEPEKVHHWVVVTVKCLYRIPGFNRLLQNFTGGSGTAGHTVIAGLSFRNRVGLAAGFDKNADFYREFSMFGFSFIEIGTVTPRPQAGNIKPRLFRLKNDSALINRMGLNNKGVDYAVQQLKKQDRNLIVGGSIGRNTDTPNEKAADDYIVCFEKLYDVVDYFSINISCPNVAGMEKLQDLDTLGEILTLLMNARRRQPVYKPVFLKISPDVNFGYIDQVLVLVRKTGLDGIIAANTTTKREGLSEAQDRIARIGAGGLSGKPLTERTVEMISYICKQTGNTLPVIAVGGVMSPENALRMIRAGAGLLQIYTGFIFEGPFLVRKINRALREYYQLNNRISDQAV